MGCHSVLRASRHLLLEFCWRAFVFTSKRTLCCSLAWLLAKLNISADRKRWFAKKSMSCCFKRPSLKDFPNKTQGKNCAARLNWPQSSLYVSPLCASGALMQRRRTYFSLGYEDTMTLHAKKKLEREREREGESVRLYASRVETDVSIAFNFSPFRQTFCTNCFAFSCPSK
jgi:hypothetical protein